MKKYKRIVNLVPLEDFRFKVTYNVDTIKDSESGAAQDSTGKVLGSREITNQEFEFRLNVVE